MFRPFSFLVRSEISLPHMICRLPNIFQISAWRWHLQVETCSWLSYYFHKVVFLTFVNLFLFIVHHSGTHKVKKTENVYLLNISLNTTNKMQRYAIFFITVNALHVSGGFCAHHQELKTVHTGSGMCEGCLFLPLAVAASKLDTYPMLCVQFLSSWWWAVKPPETCRALTVIKNVVQ